MRSYVKFKDCMFQRNIKQIQVDPLIVTYFYTFNQLHVNYV